MINKLELEDIKSASECLNFSKLKNKTILISGGGGFIGSYIIEIINYRNKYYNDNIKIISLTRRGGESSNNIINYKHDIRDKIVIDDEIDYIIHLASNTHPKQYALDPVGTITTNIFGCYNLLELARNKKVSRFVLASSVEIYGECIDKPIDENYSGYINCNNARSGYNESKRLCESLCQSYKDQYNIDFVTVRLSRVLGPDHKEDSKAMSQFIDRALNNEDIILKSKGNQLYSYIYVSDAATALLKVLIDGIKGEAYNASADIDNMILGDYANYIASLVGKKVIYQIENNNSVSKATYALLDSTKLKALGWHPRYSIKDAIEMTLKIKKEWEN